MGKGHCEVVEKFFKFLFLISTVIYTYKTKRRRRKEEEEEAQKIQ